MFGFLKNIFTTKKGMHLTSVIVKQTQNSRHLQSEILPPFTSRERFRFRFIQFTPVTQDTNKGQEPLMAIYRYIQNKNRNYNLHSYSYILLQQFCE